MIFPKKQAQRLIPEYLLDYTTKLNESHPDPTESWGGSGSNYTAGEGININENVISVDDTIAKKSEIPTNYVTLDTEQTITGLKTIGQTSGTLSEVDFSGFTFKLVNKAINSTEAEIKISNSSYDGNQHPNIYSTKGLYVNLAKIKLGDDGSNTYGITMPDSTTWESDRVLATLNDIPTVPTLATVATTGSYNDLIDKPTLATVATSGSYNDLLDKPTIPDTSNFVTLDDRQTITGPKTFQSLCTEETEEGRSSFIFPNRVQYMEDTPGITHVTVFALPKGKPSGVEYTFAMTEDIPDTSNFVTKDEIPDTTNFVTTDTEQTISGFKTFTGGLRTENTTFGIKMNVGPGRFQYDYNNQGTIERTLFDLPSKTAGTEQEPTTYTIATQDDIHNPTITFTQGGTTKGTITLNQSGDQTIEFDAGGSGGGGDTPANMVTTDTTQDITGEKTFVGSKRIKFKQSSNYDKLGFTGYDANDTEIGYLEMSKMDNSFTGNPISNILGYYSSINSAPAPSSDVMLGFKYSTLDSDGNARIYNLVVPPRYNELRATRYIPISVNGTTADNTGNINVPTQTLVFTLADNTTVTLNVMTSATSSTTTTS